MDNKEMYDVAIIGGGLAGLSLAILLANRNVKVVLFEKENYPFHKVCGEYISLESWNFLHGLDVDLRNSGLPFIDTLQLSDVRGKCYSFELPLGGFGISRYTLDYSLYTIAKEKGVKILTHTKVTEVSFSNDSMLLTTLYDTIQAKVVAGCYGKRSNLDVKWKRPFTTMKKGLNNYIGIKYHVKADHLRNQIQLHNFSNGYCGLSGIEDGKSCLCYLTTADNLKNSGNSIKQMEKGFLYLNPRLKEIFNNAEMLYDEPIAISQVSFEKKSQVHEHVLLLGDAAGMITPLCGNGMSMAMHSAKIAMQSIIPFIKGNYSRTNMEERYIAGWNKTFSKRMWIGRKVQGLFGEKVSTSLFIKLMNSAPLLARYVISSTHGTGF